MKDLYRDLSGFVHPTREHVWKGVTGKKHFFVYYEQQFLKSLQWHKTVYDAVLALLLSQYPDITNRFLEQLCEPLKEYEFEQTIQICEKLRKE